MSRVRAPELPGRGWVGTPAPLAVLRGSVVLLDFWTSGCIHCVHVLAELAALEDRFGDALVVVGVHSPKFDGEAAPGAAASAAARLGVRHPVLDDADRGTWEQYAVRAWPTLCLVDPDGYVVGQWTGEGHGDEIGDAVAELVDSSGDRLVRRLLRAPAGDRVAAPVAVLAGRDATSLVADAARGEVVHLAADLRTSLRRYPGFVRPTGLLRTAVGVVVADAGAHQLRLLDPTTGEVRPLAGSGVRRQQGDVREGPAAEVPLSAPSGVVELDGALVVADAGSHQLWELRDGRLRVLAGTGAEQLRDGPADRAYLAQPTALATSADRLWFVDAESSALRWYRDGEVGTAVGTGLFAFGLADGGPDDALLQHPEGVAVLADGSVAVADTYNRAVRRWDPDAEQLSTLADGLDQPTGLAVDGDSLLVCTGSGVVRLPLGQLSCDVPEG